MASDRFSTLRKLGKAIEEDNVWPRPLCPVCGEGYVAFDAPRTLENSQSERAHDHQAWEPEWIFGRFSADGHCENQNCRQAVVAVGTYKVEMANENQVDYNYLRYSQFFSIEHFVPPLNLLLLPEDAPDEVRDAVNRAGRLLFLDPGLSATALRASVERFLTTQGIPGMSSSGNFVSLDRRLKQWKTSGADQRVVDLLLAVKWIGNEGTHEVSDMTVSDVLDGAEFIDEAFHHLFVAPDIDARAERVNASKGRPRPPKSTP
ncbi:MAG: hypothetical protein JWR53_1603 [Glaciihabitans sp.]|nr:hypothetical protein [Glaciihabitans sp.]